MVEWRYFDLAAQFYGDDVIPENGAIAVPQGAERGLEPREEVVRAYRLA
jgi:L-alanine-DL-glutamate epimerase-like enolase superfamily enzyme